MADEEEAPRPSVAILPRSAAESTTLFGGRPIGVDTRAQVTAAVLYDQARERTTSEARADVRLTGPLSLRGGASSNMNGGGVSPTLGAGLWVLSESRHMVDGALSFNYRGEGFNLVPALELGATIGRHFGPSAVFASATYGQGLERGERYLDVRMSAMNGWFDHRLFAGVDSRLRVDLERDDDEPAHESEMDFAGGLVAGVTISGVALGGFGGLSAVRYRDRSPDRTGVLAGMNVGGAF
jgi:hypothetical protein